MTKGKIRKSIDITIKNKIRDWFAKIEIEAQEKLLSEGFKKEEISIRQKMVFLRFKGQDSSLEIPFIENGSLISDFFEQYEKVFGHKVTNREIEVEAIRVIASVEKPQKIKNDVVTAVYVPKPFSKKPDKTKVYDTGL